MVRPAIVLIAMALLANADNERHGAWPMFRGEPSLCGVSSETLPDKLDLLWSFKTEGAVKSSAAIQDGSVFVGSDEGHVHAVSLATGQKQWAFKTEGPVEASPLVLDGVVYVGSSDNHLYALDAKNGALRWKYATGDKILGAANWFRVSKDASARIVFGGYDYKLHCIDATTGKPVWTCETENYLNGAPTVADGKVIIGGCDGKLRIVSAEDGKQITAVEVGAYVAGSAAVRNGQAYFGHYGNEVACVDLADGVIEWKYEDRNFPYFSSPAVTEKVVIIGGRDKRLHCLDRESGKAMWTFQTQGNVDSSPVVCGDKVVVGSEDGRLYLLSLADGKQIWSYDVGKALIASPAVANGVIVIGSEDGNVYAFGMKKP